MKPTRAADIIKSGKAAQMSDVAFLRLARRHQTAVTIRETVPNLKKSVEASIDHLERSIKRWQHSALEMPETLQVRLRARLQALSGILDRMRRTSAVAM